MSDENDRSLELLQEDESGNGEPAAKMAKLDGDLTDQINLNDPTLSVKQILFNVNKAICCRLEAIESKLDNIGKRTKTLEDKVDHLSKAPTTNSQQLNTPLRSNSFDMSGGSRSSSRNGAVIVGLPQENKSAPSAVSPQQGTPGAYGPNVTLITLNTEDDYPDGVWLGDENSPEMRVRVPVSPSDLLHIHSNCRTAEKMALTLLDYLFDRETQATSNLSGMGKHGKKQLDPLMIYGIRCHLIHKFNISESDWHRIKLNIDSKCRTAYRRKVRGQPLTVKAFRGKSAGSGSFMSLPGQQGDMTGQSDDSMQHEDVELHIAHDQDVSMQTATVPVSVQGQHGEIQILHATEEQLAQLQQAHQIQILQAGDLQNLHAVQGEDGSVHVAVTSLNQANGGPISVTTSSGEVIHIQEQPVSSDSNVIVQQEDSPQE